MKPVFPRLPRPVAVLAWLALAFCTSSCVDKGNPVLSSTSTSTHGGTSTGGGKDGGEGIESLAPADVDAAGGSSADVPPTAASDANPTACNLLTQNCGSLALGCYPDPISGVASCHSVGEASVLVSCDTSLDPFACSRGLVCVPLSPQDTAGLCYSLCDAKDPTSCGFGNTCAPVTGLPTSSSVGYCPVS